MYAPLLMQFWIVARHNGRSYILSVLFVISRVNYFFSEGAVPPGTVPSNFRISPFRPTAQPW